MIRELEATIKQLVARGRGILAADESTPTISKRFAAVGIEETVENRRDYRDLLFTTPNLNEFISGVILYEETLGQKSQSGVLFPELLKKNGIVPGIKVDKGLIPLVNTLEEQTTQGLDGLPERLAQYKTQGAAFAKWRAVYTVDAERPSMLAIKTNANSLARYAAICQSLGIVPIVEPEVLLEGKHTIDRCAQVTEQVLHAVFHALFKNKVKLEYVILKPSMVINGKEGPKASVDEVARNTLQVLLRTVPAAVPTINFLSGGQTPELATAHLNRMHVMNPQLPWNLSFSFARALQDPALKLWKGKKENVQAAQRALYERARLNSQACRGEYSEDLEKKIAAVA